MSQGQSARRRRVLVIDDHPDTAATMALTLQELGHRAEFAINGYSALTLCETFRPDVVFVDMNLPDFHGSDLSRLLRIKCEPHPIRVIAMTGYGESERSRADSAGCDVFLKKPIDWSEINSLLA